MLLEIVCNVGVIMAQQLLNGKLQYGALQTLISSSMSSRAGN